MSSVLRRLLLVALSAGAVTAVAADRAPVVSRPDIPAASDCAECVPGEILVQFRAATGALQRSAALAAAGGVQIDVLRAPLIGRSLVARPELVRARVAGPVAGALARLREDPGVELAEPVYRIHASAVSNDTYYVNGLQWGAFSPDAPAAAGPAGTTNGFGTQAELAWARGIIGRGDVYVGILDEGVANLHPELDTVTWRNPFDYADGRDNDGNGYVDDVSGWDFVNRNNTTYDGGTTGSTDRHGTQVAGVIGAEGGNGAGIAGTCWTAGMIPLKVLSNGTGTTADAVLALNYLADLKARHGFNIVAVNCSWSTTAYSQALHDAVLRVARAGILVVTAAGNTGTDLDVARAYPACLDTRVGTSTMAAASYDAVITVAAIDSAGALPSWSNRGAASVDIAAPGVQIVTTSPPWNYALVSGTSMAAAHVSGAIALFAAGRPGSTAAEMRSAILGARAATPSLSGMVAGGGRLDVSAAFGQIAVHDAAITGVSVVSPVAQNRTVAVTVTVRNQGTVAETVTLSLTDAPPPGGRAGIVSAPVTLSLAAGATTVQGLTWNTTGATEGLHLLSAQLRPLAGETDMSDNTRGAYSSVTLVVTPYVGIVTPSVMRGGTIQSVTIAGSGFAAGARPSFTGGTGPQPALLGVTVAPDGRSVTMSLSAAATPTRGAPWDVTVTNPDGRAGRKLDAFTVAP